MEVIFKIKSRVSAENKKSSESQVKNTPFLPIATLNRTQFSAAASKVSLLRNFYILVRSVVFSPNIRFTNYVII